METLYLRDCYIKEFETIVKEANSKYTVLENTAFYPNSGGQPNDTGEILRLNDNKVFKVVFVKKMPGFISHEIDSEGLNVGDKVKCKIDWGRRYLFMRYHTASHVLSAVLNKETEALITGNQIGEDKTRVDFSLENFDREQIKSFEEKANEIIKKSLPVSFNAVSRKELLKNPNMIKLAKGLPKHIKEIRIVDIEGFDQQACGGCHVKNTKEIGKIRIIDTVNKGKNNRRIYFTLQ